MKKCGKCGVLKNKDNFYPAKNTRDGLYAWCKECYLGYAKSRPKRKRSSEDSRRYNLMSCYGLTPEEYDALLAKQGGTCATCDKRPDGTKNFHVDHDHSCCPGNKTCGSCVRGVLCSQCNKALGLINDSIEILDKMKVYLTSI